MICLTGEYEVIGLLIVYLISIITIIIIIIKNWKIKCPICKSTIDTKQKLEFGEYWKCKCGKYEYIPGQIMPFLPLIDKLKNKTNESSKPMK